MTPITFETLFTLNREYIHDMSGLCATNGWIPAASSGVNFSTPMSNRATTNPYREVKTPATSSCDWFR
jgi:hypothetical protein